MCVLLVSVLICKYVSFITCAFIYPYLLSYVCCDDILYTWQVRNDFNKDVYSFDPYIWAKIRKISYFDPYFLSKFGEMYSFDPLFRPFVAFRVNMRCWASLSETQPRTPPPPPRPDSKVHGAHLGQVGPRWAPCRPHEPCYQGTFSNFLVWKYVISLKSVFEGPINNIPASIQIMVWRRPGDKQLSEPMMVRLPTHMRVTRPQSIN